MSALWGAVGVGLPDATNSANSRLLSLPVELQLMVCREALCGLEWPRDQDALLTCRQLYPIVSEAMKLERGNIVHTFPEPFWTTAVNAARDAELHKAIADKGRRMIRTIKLIGIDSNISNWAPHITLTTLALHNITPSQIILYNSFTPSPSGTDIDALTGASWNVVANTPNVDHITIANVPRNQVFFLGCRLLNLWFHPLLDIVQMSDDMLRDFNSTGDKHIELNVPFALAASPAAPAVVPRVTIRVTTLAT